jgi:ferredoxin
LEKDAAELISAFIKSGKITGHDFSVSQQEQDKLENALAGMLQQAHYLGETYGRLMVDHTARAAYEEGTMILRDISIGRFFTRAKEIVSGIVGRIRDIVSGIFSKGGTTEEAEEAVDNLLDHLPDTIATTEIHTEVEDAVLETLKDNGTEQVEWICEPGACETCQDNEDQGLIDIGDSFSSGHDNPPAHPNCRCVTMIPLKDESDK